MNAVSATVQELQKENVIVKVMSKIAGEFVVEKVVKMNVESAMDQVFLTGLVIVKNTS